MPWVEGLAGNGSPKDVVILTGLQYLCGLDMTHDDDLDLVHHGAPGSYVLPDDEVRRRFTVWLKYCSEHDADLIAWLQTRLANRSG
ncbi:MAG: hypothetical protein JWP75_2564 [Frondihabitans sp.]|nr:hypothetical protein [Frondihabitans sp.]